MTVFSSKAFSLNQNINLQNTILACLCLIICIVTAIDFSIGTGVLFPLAIAGIGFLVATYLLPEMPFVILYMGMPIWVIVGTYIPLRDGQPTIITAIWASLCVIVHWLLVQKDKTKKLEWDWCDIALGVFTLWIWLSLLWGSNYTYGFNKALIFTVTTTSIYFLARFGFGTASFSPKRLAYLMITAGLGHAFIVALAAYNLGGLWGLESNLRKHYFLKRVWGIGTVGGADSLAFGLLATAALFLMTQSQRSKLFLGFAFAIQLWAFSTYQQRNASIGIFVGIIFMYYVLTQANLAQISSKQIIVTIVIGLFCLPLIGYFLYGLNPSFRSDYLASDYSYQSRFTFFQIGLDAFWQNPIIGSGSGGLGTALRSGYDEFFIHNRYLEIAAEFGIIGFMFIVWFSVLLFRRLQIVLPRVDSPPVLLGLMIAGAVLLQRYLLSITGGDLSGWRMGLWSALVVTIYAKLPKNDVEQIDEY